MRHHIFGLTLLLSTFGVFELKATVISTATVSGLCDTSQTNTGTSNALASVSCLSSSASANSSFDITSPSLSNLAFNSSAQPSNVSTSTASLSNSFIVTGGSGIGFLALDFSSTIGGSNDPQASANATLNVMLNGSLLDNTRVCGSTPAVGGPFNCSVTIPIGFAFSYDTPFSLDISLTGVAGGGLGGSNISGSGQFSYAILTDGQVNPNGKLTLVPEPSFAPLLIPALLLAARSRFRGARNT
jgi:hypothetical protein